ncbi:hypothetical protein SAMN05660472_00432 [Natronincola ferrireducens]|uniref:Phosphatidylglycerol lysyltransferase n=1 Tax=Natronincola ferrireducens TaxID=393762 RepID=A0A1G8Y5D5_9FIRM|nr:hypothetical protein SAMN05660472_00432 [Natronincola ferrireducens]
MTILLIAVLLWQANLQDVIGVLEEVDPLLILGVCLLQIITMLIINFQWYKLAAIIGEKPDFKQLLSMNMVGTFVESITPSAKAGGEVTKIYLLKSQLGFSAGEATVLVTLQKIISLFTFLLLNTMAVAAFLCMIHCESLQLQVLLLSTLFLVLWIASLVVFLIYPNKVKKILKVLPIKEGWRIKLHDFIGTIETTLQSVMKDKKKLLPQFLLSLCIWGLFAVKAYLIARGLKIQLPFISIAVVTYLTYMIGMLPLLPGGIGTFEGGMVFFLLPLGVPVYQAIAFALTLRFVTFWFVFLISGGWLGFKEIKKIRFKWKTA